MIILKTGLKLRAWHLWKDGREWKTWRSQTMSDFTNIWFNKNKLYWVYCDHETELKSISIQPKSKGLCWNESSCENVLMEPNWRPNGINWMKQGVKHIHIRDGVITLFYVRYDVINLDICQHPCESDTVYFIFNKTDFNVLLHFVQVHTKI